jgi:HEAT repeat protein
MTAPEKIKAAGEEVVEMTAPAPRQPANRHRDDVHFRSAQATVNYGATEGSTVDKQSRRVCIYWGVALTLLVSTAIFCWALVVPVWRVHSALGRLEACSDVSEWRQHIGAEISELGGPETAARGIGLYVKLPLAVAPHRYQAAIVLGECGGAAVPVLVRMLDDEDGWQRIFACESLGDIGDRRAVPFLLVLLGSQEHWVRDAAVEALGTLKDARAVRPLIAVLDHRPVAQEPDDELRLDQWCLPDEDSIIWERTATDVRCTAAWALGNIGEQRAYEALLSRMQDKDEHTEVRGSAAVGLGLLKASAAARPLLQTMDSDTKDLARSAAVGLYHMRCRAAIPRMIAALQDEDDSMRAVAAFVLGELKAKDGVSALKLAMADSARRVRDNAKEALAKIRAEKPERWPPRLPG